MSSPDTSRTQISATALTYVAYASFLANWDRNCAVGSDVADALGAMVTELFAGRGIDFCSVRRVDAGGRTIRGSGSALGIPIRDQDGASRDGIGSGIAADGSEGDGNLVHRCLWCGAWACGASGEFGGGGGESGPPKRTVNVLNFCWSVGAVACPFLLAAAVKRQRVPAVSGGRGWICAAGGDCNRGHAIVYR